MSSCPPSTATTEQHQHRRRLQRRSRPQTSRPASSGTSTNGALREEMTPETTEQPSEQPTLAPSNAIVCLPRTTRPSGRRRRRTKLAIGTIRDRMRSLLEADHPMTCRQLFYQMVARGHIQKTEGEYKTTIVRLLADMRRCGELPYEW